MTFCLKSGVCHSVIRLLEQIPLSFLVDAGENIIEVRRFPRLEVAPGQFIEGTLEEVGDLDGILQREPHFSPLPRRNDVLMGSADERYVRLRAFMLRSQSFELQFHLLSFQVLSGAGNGNPNA